VAVKTKFYLVKTKFYLVSFISPGAPFAAIVVCNNVALYLSMSLEEVGTPGLDIFSESR
jgi:hypothetical protein